LGNDQWRGVTKAEEEETGRGEAGVGIVRGQSLRRLPRIDPPVVGRPSCPLEMRSRY